MGPAVPLAKASIRTRFSTLRFNKVVKEFKPIQISFVKKYGFPTFLHLPKHFMPPPQFLQWLLDHSSVGKYGVFEKKSKSIKFKKEMFNLIFGLPPGTIPFVLESDDRSVINEVEALRKKYLVNGRITMENLVKEMLADYSEVGFMRSFVLFFISLILCPLTYNSVNPKYLFSLRDTSLIPNLDYGQLCFDHLFTEIRKWRDKVFEPADSRLYNRLLWVGGCTPAMAVVYLDFLDFTGYNVSIDYGLPRIRHVKNSDFKYIMNFDRNKSSRKQFGVLPLKDISETPYSNDIPPASPMSLFDNSGAVDVPIQYEGDTFIREAAVKHRERLNTSKLNDGLSIPDLEPARVIALSSLVEPCTGPVTRSMKKRCFSGSSNPVEVVILSSTDVSPTGSKKMKYSVLEPIALSSPFAQKSRTAAGSENGAGAEISAAAGGTTSIANSGLRRNRKAPAIRFLSAQAKRDEVQILATAETISPSQHVEPGTEPHTGPSTREKRNRKKRAAKALSPESVIYKKKVDPIIDAFYTKFVRNKFYATTDSNASPDFIDIAGFRVTYESFRESYKPRGWVSDEVMAAFGQYFNFENKELSFANPKCSKFVFSPYLTKKLIEEPHAFEKDSCVTEIKKINAEINLSNIDLMHFPFLSPSHWVDACVNNVFSLVNFFDSAALTSKNTESKFVTNLVTNLHTVFKEVNIQCKDFKKFTTLNPPEIPLQTTLHHCAFSVMLYMEHWNGKKLKDFSKVVIPKFMMIMAYNLYHSELNKIKAEPSVATKKPRRG